MLGFLTPLIPLWKLLSVIENSLAERKKNKYENPADKVRLVDPFVFAQMIVLLATFQVTLSRFPVFYYGLFYSELQRLLGGIRLVLGDLSAFEDEAAYEETDSAVSKTEAQEGKKTEISGNETVSESDLVAAFKSLQYQLMNSP